MEFTCTGYTGRLLRVNLTSGTAEVESIPEEIKRDFLGARGCDEVQGYLFSPPVAPLVVAELVRHARFR